MSAVLKYPTYQLDDKLTAQTGQVFLTGTQALVRLVLMQRALDLASGWNTAAFVSGYRGSPLGGVDQQLWKAHKLLQANGVHFLPAINEELAGTAVLGTQRLESDPQRTVEGVTALWYGKGPGVDRAGDALRHGHAYGASSKGGVLVVAGDDHGCVSSSMPHQSDFVLAAWQMPVLHPANVAELIEFGLYGWALSRATGAWVGLKAISETVESAATVNLDALQTRWTAPTTYQPGPDGLHNRWPDLPSLSIEARLTAKLEAVRAFARNNSIDRSITAAPGADIGILTCGKAHLDLLETLRRLGLSLADLDAAGVRIYKVGLVFPLELTRLDAFAKGLREILVIEEKGALLEQQVRNHFYNRPEGRRPRVVGKTDAEGAPLLSALGELRPSRIMPVFAAWLAHHKPLLDRRDRVVDFVAPQMLSNEGDAVRRRPYFCSGCPHNTSTRVPEGSVAQAGIGCHFMASWMDRDTEGLIQMGGEGVDWVSHSAFTERKHIFQNLGDGTYFHSGVLAIRQAVAAHKQASKTGGSVNITYKILYNDAVAMTGGQPVDGPTSVPQIARQVEAEGVSRLVVVSDEPEKYQGFEEQFPRGTTFHDRSELDAVQRELREIAGVTVLLYDQTCAAEKRRRRKKNEYPNPPRRLFINAAVCEGCGDCGAQSNCLSVEPLETPLGRKRRIEQTSCNKDYSCVQGFCPSFVSVIGAAPRKPVGKDIDAQALADALARLPMPQSQLADAPWDLMITGVGGTGVVTIGALVTMAAHLEGRAASQLDFMGFAQKGGAVYCYVRFAATPDLLNQVRIDTQQADWLLACDLVVGASGEALQTVRHGRTRVTVNTHPIPTDSFVRNPDTTLQAPALLAKLRHAAGVERLSSVDAQALALRLMGDTMPANMLLLGHCWQEGGIPLSLAALDRAIELNAVNVAANRTAFALGRLAAADPQALEALSHGHHHPAETHIVLTLDQLIADRMQRLTDYQNAALAQRFAALVALVRTRELALQATLPPSDDALPLTRAVATSFYQLLAVKDEYEVARLYADPAFVKSLREDFDGAPGKDYKLAFHMAPPLLARPGPHGEPPRKITLGPWLLSVLKMLAKLRGLRGSLFDPFGHSLERRVERQLADDFEVLWRSLTGTLTAEQLPDALKLAQLPQSIRGYGHVKLRNLVAVQDRALGLMQGLGLPIAATGAIGQALDEAARRQTRGAKRVIEIKVAA
jgi:indolepyruvate ferredoxin oxidoreductase